MKVAIYLCVSLALVAWCSESVGARLHSAEWEAYKEQHGKVYEDLTEDLQRYANYLATKQLIQEHNSAQSASSFRMELNHMADWSMDEFTGAAVASDRKGVSAIASARRHVNLSSPIPDEIDWRTDPDYQIVSPVKDQGKCNAGYAFATAGVLEGQMTDQELQFAELSAQQLVDCSKADMFHEANRGCKGGQVADALIDLSMSGGIASDKTYPYVGKQQDDCGYTRQQASMLVAGMKIFEKIDEKRLARYVARLGPIAIEIDATDKLKSYKGGVFDDSTCKQKEPNHSVLIVGYGKDKQAGDFWIVKNSWSTKWGEQGYFRLKRGVNACGVLYTPTIPLFL